MTRDFLPFVFRLSLPFSSLSALIPLSLSASLPAVLSYSLHLPLSSRALPAFLLLPFLFHFPSIFLSYFPPPSLPFPFSFFFPLFAILSPLLLPSRFTLHPFLSLFPSCFYVTFPSYLTLPTSIPTFDLSSQFLSTSLTTSLLFPPPYFLFSRSLFPVPFPLDTNIKLTSASSTYWIIFW